MQLPLKNSHTKIESNTEQNADPDFVKDMA